MKNINRISHRFNTPSSNIIFINKITILYTLFIKHKDYVNIMNKYITFTNEFKSY